MIGIEVSPDAMTVPRRRNRLRARLWKHHLPLCGLASISVASLYVTRPFSDVITRLSFSTAYPALALLVVTLLIGPWKLLRRQANPVSSDLRRDIGIWAGILGIVHSVVGQCVHLRGRPWLYYVYGPTEHHHSFPVRHDLFGFSNYTGVIGVLLLIALFATSNDLLLNRLGAVQWKKLQRWNYAVFALAGAHAVGYLFIEKQKIAFVMTVALWLSIAVVLQLSGYWMRANSAGRSAPIRGNSST